MDRQPLYVHNRQSVSQKQMIERGEREIAQVLVIDRVELNMLDQFTKIGSLDNDNAAWL